MADELLHVVDVIVEVKRTFRQRHTAGVFPVSDVDLVVFQHGFHGVTQQRGVVAGQRGHDQHSGLTFKFAERVDIVGKTLEAA